MYGSLGAGNCYMEVVIKAASQRGSDFEAAQNESPRLNG